jgi:hypothetical protein
MFTGYLAIVNARAETLPARAPILAMSYNRTPAFSFRTGTRLRHSLHLCPQSFSIYYHKKQARDTEGRRPVTQHPFDATSQEGDFSVRQCLLLMAYRKRARQENLSRPFAFVDNRYAYCRYARVYSRLRYFSASGQLGMRMLT